uniref:Vacuolar protein-sorting-associated protein 25 n=1 Tax=Triatoma dimidiata TaxID=72491 RepID=A0A0V0G7Q1_TRIDM
MKSEDWPWQYSFPPFFTVQPNLHTRSLQVSAWTSLVLKYHRLSNQYLLDVQEAKSSLFTNPSIERTLPEEGITLVMSALVSSKNAEPIDKHRTRYYIYWHTLEEWAAILGSWATDTGHSGSVCTLYELINTPNQEFTGMHQDVLIKVIKVLEAKNEAELILMEDNNGVKFF